jgi:hypothetical protein
LGLTRLVALGEHSDARLAAGAVREHQRAAELLVGVPDVQAKAEVRLDRLVELDPLEALQHLHGLDRRVVPLTVDRGARRPVDLPVPHRRKS